MLDPHVHLRDWKQRDKETLFHGFQAASCMGIDTLFEMPNTDPPITSERMIRERIADARQALDRLEALHGGIMTYGLYAGLTSDPLQQQEVLRAYHELFPLVIGFKLFAGHSTGNMGIIDVEDQLRVYRSLADAGFGGLLAVHCEKESLLRPDLWNPDVPGSHSEARPAEAETASVADQIEAAVRAGFKGILHICHVSCPETVELIEHIRSAGTIDYTITCGVTPHHALLCTEGVSHAGNLVKMNPPLRSRERQVRLYEMLRSGRIDWIESDHAPHTLTEKAAGASGIPGFAGYGRLVVSLLKDGVSQDEIRSLTGDRFRSVVGLPKRDGVNDLNVAALQGRIEDCKMMYPWDPWDMCI